MILFISKYRFPEGDAGSERELYLAQAYKRLGHEVLFWAHGERKEGIHKGVPYISLRINKHRVLSHLLWYPRLKIKFLKFSKREDIEAVIVGAIDSLSFEFLKKWCRRNGAAFIIDSVEWYDARQFKYGTKSRIYQSNNKLVTQRIDHHCNVISISSYLHSFYTGKGIKSVNIPVIFNQDEVPYIEKKASEKLMLLYAGSPERKDFLDVMLQGLNLLSDELLSRIHFNIIGASEEQIINILCDDAAYLRLKPVLSIWGRKSMSFVREIMREADFNVLLRDGSYRNAKAGFSTKVVEGITYSTPFIMNFTSDLEFYFTDGVDCIKVGDFTASAFCDAVKRALSMSSTDKAEMRKKAKKTAIRSFNIDSYTKQLKDILNY